METQSLAGEGVGGPNSDEGTETLVLYENNNLPYDHTPTPSDYNPLIHKHGHTDHFGNFLTVPVRKVISMTN